MGIGGLYTLEMGVLGALYGGNTLQLSELFSDNTEGIYLPSLRDAVSQGNMFQDSNGTTPVTGVEQPVGLVLEGSQGVELGPELVTNGTFDTDTIGWTPTRNAILSSIDSKLQVTASETTLGGAAAQAINTVVGKSYVLHVDVFEQSGGRIRIAVGTKSDLAASGDLYYDEINVTPNTHFKIVFTATSTTSYVLLSQQEANNYTAVFDNISIREVLGNHLIQPTDADRPILSARVNMLENTEDLTADSWIKNSVTVTGEQLAPDGTNTATKLEFTSADALYASTSPGIRTGDKKSIWARSVSGTGTIGLLGYKDYAKYQFMITEEWQRFEALVDTSETGGQFFYIADSRYGTLNDVIIWHPDLRSADQATGLIPDYQRVGDVDIDPTDYDWGDFPWYLAFNGVNTWMYVQNMTPNSDEVLVVVGVRNEVDPDVYSAIFELGPNSSNAGTCTIGPMSVSDGYRISSNGGNFVQALVGSGYGAPITNVVRGVAKIGDNICAIYADNQIKESNIEEQGFGNYANDTLYIGSRAGSSYFLNGNIYSLILTFKIPSNRVISKAERLVNKNTRAY